MKKSTRPPQEEIDNCDRLRILTKQSYSDIEVIDIDLRNQHVCGYQLGYFLFIDNLTVQYRLKEYINGQLNNEIICNF